MNLNRKYIYLLLLALVCLQVVAQKPRIWIHTDMTAAYDYSKTSSIAEAETDQNSDPDDHVALAIYLMMANKFDTKAIVMGVTNRNTNMNVLTFFNETFRPAYASDVECLNRELGGYPAVEDIPAYESSLTAGNNKIEFDDSPIGKYDSYSSLPATVKLLVDELKKDDYSYEAPLYVLEWGGMTEAAMVIRHLQRNNEIEALRRMYIVSHWHTSYTNTQSNNNCYSGSDADKYGCANCNVNCEACRFVRNEAKKTDALFRWVDLASVGQTGIVNGYNNYFNGGIDGSTYRQFQKSRLGDLFVKSKFAYGKPDGSDCATFYAVLGNYGVTLSDYNNNGQTTASQESSAMNKFKSRGHDMLDELMNISNIASGDCSFGAPTGLRGSSSGSKVQLTWNAITVDEFSHYVIYRGSTPFNIDTLIESHTSATFTDETATEGASYYYQLEAVYNEGTKALSPDLVKVTNGDNPPPVADAGKDTTILSLEDASTVNVMLNGSGSTDNGNISSYEWLINGAAIAQGEAPSVALADGTHNITLLVTDSQGANAMDEINITVKIISEALLAIPGKIEAENYINEDDVDTQGTTDIGGGLNVGWINDGDWAEYAVDVQKTATYKVDVRAASAMVGGKLTFLTNGSTIGSVDILSSGGWQTWRTFSAYLNLNEGKQVLRTVYNGETSFLYNLNWIEFSDATPVLTNSYNKGLWNMFYMKNTQNLIIEPKAEPTTSNYYIFDINGKMCLNGKVNLEGANLDLSNLPMGYYIAVLTGDKQNERYKFIK